ncbi:discoidin domain-containing protein [Chitinophaga arvensicola]|uniref:F5/8 type C domain-containing protein n=1 Tax=Chitinophaga arvensicola TaxID=29529 RepID=A0A1I0RVE4_9BACT|nr:discoidin domain-containing protein [Chitinophaga arvensicola]SEW45290.1 F5/8 type C domain-containing protein [Chitinophaga arvensicola]
MKCYQSTKHCLLIILVLIGAALMGCTKKTARHYDLLPPDPEEEKDLTQLAIGLTVNIENSGGPNAKEGSSKVIDGNIDTKFLIFSFAPNFFIELDYDIAQRLDAYTLTSADDADGRDPKDWQIVASNDSTKWTVLDDRKGQLFDSRKKTVRYEFTNANKYKFYRLAITSLKGGTSGLFQLAEWRVISRPH